MKKLFVVLFAVSMMTLYGCGGGGGGTGPTSSTTTPTSTPTSTPVATFAGVYSGTYSGADSGTVTVTLGSNGNISGTGKSTVDPSYQFTISGQVSTDGNVSLTSTGSAGTATFRGSVTLQGVLSGTWSDGTTGGGNFTAQKTTSPLDPNPTVATSVLLPIGSTELYFNRYSPLTSDGTHLFVVHSDGTGKTGILKIVLATGELTEHVLSGEFGFSDIVTDGINLYATNSGGIGGSKVYKIAIDTWTVTTLAGSVFSRSNIDGVGTAATFSSPRGITICGTNLYVGDENRIRKIDTSTGAVTTFAGTGVEGSTDGASNVATFYSPQGITNDGTNLYVTEYGNNKIRKIVIATGEVTTFAGSGVGGGVDGVGSAASFDRPIGITNDGTNLYVAEPYAYRIRKIVISTGSVTNLAGWVKGAEDGVGIAASFDFPDRIVDIGTNLYVSDYWNHSIRKIAKASQAVTTFASTTPTGGTGGLMGTWCTDTGGNQNCWVFDNDTGSTTGSFYQQSINQYSGTLTNTMTWSVDMSAHTLTYQFTWSELTNSSYDYSQAVSQPAYTFPFTLDGSTFTFQNIAFKRK